MVGQLGVSRTLDRLLSQFWWPGIGADLARFVKSCDACQRTTPKERVGKAPMMKMPIIRVPFRFGRSNHFTFIVWESAHLACGRLQEYQPSR